MKKRIALSAAIISGLYLLIAGPLPDPIPLIDEGIMMMIFLASMKAMGKDAGSWLPFFGKKSPTASRNASGRARDATVDV